MNRKISCLLTAMLTAFSVFPYSPAHYAAAAGNELSDSGIDYTEATGTIQNPGAGYTSTVWANCAPGNTPVYSPSGSLVLFFIDIGSFSSGKNGTTSADGKYTPGKDYDLDDAFFRAWRETLSNCRKNGCMVGMRFRYDAKGTADPEPATFEQVLAHVQQIKDSHILDDYSDIIAFVESGFVGKWGEQHGGKYTTVEYKAQLLDAVLDAVPDTIPVTVRTPDTFAEWAGIKRSQLTDPDIISAAEQSGENSRVLSKRVGMYNDGYMGSNSDLGTYSDRVKETDWLSSVSTETYYGGEFSSDLEEALASESYLPENAVPEMYKTHLSYINSNIFQIYKDYTFGSVYDVSGVDNSAYYGQSVFQFIRDHIGYRFVLRSSQLNDSLEQGGRLSLRFSVENTGFANPINHTNGSIILEQNGIYIKAPVDLDSHFWRSCTVTDCAVDMKLPDNLPTGKWNVYLKESMGGYYYEPAEMPLRSIRFANNGIWNSALGANRLGTITVSESASHGYDNSLCEISDNGLKNGSDEFFCANTSAVVDGEMSYAGEWDDSMQIASNSAGQTISVRADEESLYVMSHMPEGASAPVYNLEFKVPGQDNERYWIYYESGGYIYFNHDDPSGCGCKWKGDTVEFRLPFSTFGISPGDTINNLRVFLQDSGNSWKLMGDVSAKSCVVPADMRVFSCERPLRLKNGQEQQLKVYTPVENATYQWYKDGNAITGAAADTYTITSASEASAGKYSVKITYGNIVKEAQIADVLKTVSHSNIAGDVNSDSSVSVADLIMLDRWLLCAGEITAPENADLLNDGTVNAYDMILMRKMLSDK